MSKAGKWLYTAVTILEVLFLAGSCIVDYFTRKKMGMARYISYMNYSWEAKYPVETLSHVVMLTLSLLAAAVLILLLLKRKKADRQIYVRAGVMIVLTVLYVWFTLTGSRETQRSYYFVSALYGAAAAIQIMKTGIGVIRSKNA